MTRCKFLTTWAGPTTGDCYWGWEVKGFRTQIAHFKIWELLCRIQVAWGAKPQWGAMLGFRRMHQRLASINRGNSDPIYNSPSRGRGTAAYRWVFCRGFPNGSMVQGFWWDARYFIKPLCKIRIHTPLGFSACILFQGVCLLGCLFPQRSFPALWWQ